MNTIRTILSISSSYKWEIHQMDVKSSFLNGDLNEEINMQHPLCFINVESSNLVCKLHLILEEEGELGSTIGTKLEEETKIWVTGDNEIFSVTWVSTDSGGEDTSAKWTSLQMITLWVEVSKNL